MMSTMMSDWSGYISLCKYFYLCAGDDKTITVFCNARSNIQFGNYNTMNISEPRCSGKKPDSGQPLAPSSSSACYSNGPAATGVSASKAPVKIIGK